MSKKPKYTDDQIKAKLVELIASQKEEPTVAQARSFIGEGAGSNSKIGPMLREALREAASQKKQVAELPETLQQQIMQAIAPIWQYAQDLGLSQVDRIEAEAQMKLTALETENDDLLAQLDDREAFIIDLEKRIADMESQSMKDRKDLSDVNGQNLVFAMKNEDLMNKCDDLLAEITQLKDMNSELQKELINLVKQASK